MWKTIKEGIEEEVKTYGLFVSILIAVVIIFLIISFVIITFFPTYYEDNCTLKIAFASAGTFLVSMGLIQRAKTASKKVGGKK